MKATHSALNMLRTMLQRLKATACLSACLQSCCQGLAYYSDWAALRNTGNMMCSAALMGKHGDNRGSAHLLGFQQQADALTSWDRAGSRAADCSSGYSACFRLRNWNLPCCALKVPGMAYLLC